MEHLTKSELRTKHAKFADGPELCPLQTEGKGHFAFGLDPVSVGDYVCIGVAS